MGSHSLEHSLEHNLCHNKCHNLLDSRESQENQCKCRRNRVPKQDCASQVSQVSKEIMWFRHSMSHSQVGQGRGWSKELRLPNLDNPKCTVSLDKLMLSPRSRVRLCTVISQPHKGEVTRNSRHHKKRLYNRHSSRLCSSSKPCSSNKPCSSSRRLRQVCHSNLGHNAESSFLCLVQDNSLRL